MSLRGPTCIFLCVSALWCASSRAEWLAERDAYEIDLALDLPVAGLALGGALALGWLSWDLEPACGASCDAAGVNVLDRGVIGNRSDAAAITSDAFLVGTVVFPFALGALERLAGDGGGGWRGYGTDALILAETGALTLLINQVFKIMIQRPRPYVYDENLSDEERLEDDAAVSFFSGHSALSFSMATAGSMIFARRNPDSPWRWPVWIGTHAIAAATAYLRVHAGKHFWTDVLVGAAVGSGLGLLIPWLHETSASGGLALQPLVVPGGAGLSLQIY